ncbi:MAG: EamA family transporter [Candidatus Thorarchaeota archaeon]|nr:EamA family transporter [Candidatus Thorarchaeota archaeon]
MNTESTQEAGTAVRHHLQAVLMAVFVTVLWSSSWVIIKFGLTVMPPMVFSGLRYTIASIILMLWIVNNESLRVQVTASKGSRFWAMVVLYGIVFVGVTQGAQYVGLRYLQAVTVSMLLNMTPVVVLVMGAVKLGERPSALQILTVLIAVLGVLVYFYPVEIDFTETLAIVVVVMGVLANAMSSVMGRKINEKRTVSPTVVTGVSMLVGGPLLLLVGLATEGTITLSPYSWTAVLWLAVANTAIAFSIWNRAMQALRAVDIAMINSMMLPQIAVLSVIFLGEWPDVAEWIGLGVLAISVLVLQLSQARKLSSSLTDGTIHKEDIH